MTDNPVRHAVTRIRRERRRRNLVVDSIEMLSPTMKRIHLTGAELADFDSASPDDHVKLFFPDAAGDRAMRDYTPRAFDIAARRLTIDFALHDAGPATRWAIDAAPGDPLSIGGPQGSAVVADDFDWYLLVGDETALPSIGRRLEELRPGVPVIVVALVDTPEDRFALPARDGLTVDWNDRTSGADDGAILIGALDRLSFPAGEGYVWIAAETGAARAVRTHVVDVLRHPREWVKAAGYWIRGESGSEKRIED